MGLLNIVEDGVKIADDAADGTKAADEASDANAINEVGQGTEVESNVTNITNEVPNVTDEDILSFYEQAGPQNGSNNPVAQHGHDGQTDDVLNYYHQQNFLDQVGAADHLNDVTNVINPVDHPSLLNEDQKHSFVAHALGARHNPNEAFNTLSNVAGKQLEDIGIPRPNYDLDDSLREGEGLSTFNNDGKTNIKLSPEDFEDFDGNGLGSEAVSAMYHESVHAEQGSLAHGINQENKAPRNPREVRLAREFADELGIVEQIQNERGDAYRNLPSEQEAYQADADVGDLYERVGAMHDELKEKMNAHPVGSESGDDDPFDMLDFYSGSESGSYISEVSSTPS
jgi:hypothetical protein